MQHAHAAVQLPQNAFIAALVAAKVMLEACLLAAFATPCPPVTPKTSHFILPIHSFILLFTSS